MYLFTNKKVIANEKGQSSMEFLMVAVVFLVFILFHITLSLSFISTNYIDYAVFMASRAVTSSYEGTNSDIEAETGNIFRRVLSTFLRTDGEPRDEKTPPDQTFIAPFVTLVEANSGLGTTDVNRVPLGTSFQKDRYQRASVSFRHIFFLGGVYLPKVSRFTHVDDTGVVHYFRREPAINECRGVSDILRARFPTAQSDDKDAFDDNGC